MAKLDPSRQWEWVCRWVFSITGIRPKLDCISDRDLALLIRRSPQRWIVRKSKHLHRPRAAEILSQFLNET